MVPAEAITLIKKWEGLRLKAYRCSAGVLTIGYGTTANVKEGMTISEADAQLRLISHLNKLDNELSTLVNVPLKSHQRAALLSFLYNLGSTNFRTSGLRKKINSMDIEGIKVEWLKWCKANGKEVQGLKNRREDELALFLSELLPDGPSEAEVNDKLQDVEDSILKF